MAMLPFCGYNMADYFQHWFDIGKKIENQPKIFHVNWFKIDENNEFLWPGFGDNLRVLEWIIERSNEKIAAKKTPIGYIPFEKDMDFTGLDIDKKSLEKLFEVNYREWHKEANEIAEFYKKFGEKLPQELNKELAELKERLDAKK